MDAPRIDEVINRFKLTEQEMLTNKITGFSADLLNTVRGILGEAKKCPADCECEKCEAEEDEKEEAKEGYVPTADEPTDANKKTADKVRALLAKEKKPVKEEIDADLEAELKATRQTTKSIRGHSRGAMGRAVMKKERNLAQARMDRAAEMKKEEAEHTNFGTPECCGQCDTAEQIDEATAKIVAHLQKRYGDNIRKSHVRSAASDFGVDASKLAKAVRTKLGKTSLAEDEQIDEVSKATLGRYINKAKDSIDMASYRQGHKEAHGSSSKPLEKKLTKRHKGISTAVNKLTKEESDYLEKDLKKRKVNNDKAIKDMKKMGSPMKNPHFGEEAEQIDELSKGTMGRYINKAATKMGSQGVTAGLKIAADEKSSKNFKDMGKREKGIKLAVSKLTKEDAEQVDEGSYKDNPRHMGTIGPITTDAERRERAKKYREKLTKEEQDFIDALNNDTLDEARGRPKKAGAKDFTIHPKTKEKLMHNNPEHMAKIERLQKNKVLDKPKVEAGQHIMNQLSKAKTSMLGGSTIHFTHGDSKHVSGVHAAKLLSKYAGMKPSEKEDFQKKIGHSHEQLMKHV
jgi:hypothetical protein